MSGLEHTTRNPDETFALGQRLGELLVGGDVLALSGPLGAGKTQLIKGIGRGIGVPEDEPIVSPTFVLIREYAGRLTLYHIDAYRLGDAAELFDLGLEEMVADPGGVTAIEWADRVPEAITDSTCRVEMFHVGPTERRAVIVWRDAARLSRLARSVSA